MKRWVFGLFGMMFLGANVYGQTPAPVWNQNQVTPAAHHQVVSGPGCGCAETTCVPQPYVKKINKTVYCCGSEPFCTPYFWGWCAHWKCDAGHCDHPRTRRYLMKKTVTHEENSIKCVPEQAPACGH